MTTKPNLISKGSISKGLAYRCDFSLTKNLHIGYQDFDGFLIFDPCFKLD